MATWTRIRSCCKSLGESSATGEMGDAQPGVRKALGGSVLSAYNNWSRNSWDARNREELQDDESAEPQSEAMEDPSLAAHALRMQLEEAYESRDDSMKLLREAVRSRDSQKRGNPAPSTIVLVLAAFHTFLSSR